MAGMTIGPTPESIATIAPWRFRAPLSPDMAARLEGRTLPYDEMVVFCAETAARHEGPLLVEGVGGVMVPLDDRHTVLDWIADLGFPAVLVAGTYLGTISHTLTALSVLEARSLPVRAVILSETEGSGVSTAETVATLQRFISADIRVVPRGGADKAPDLTDLLTR